MATTTVSVCLRCGTIGKFGKMSCCARGGSWFKSCGGVGNAKRQHTWHEGIQACQARSQSKTVIGQQLNGAQRKGTGASQRAGRASYKEVIAATKTAFTLVNTSAQMSETTSIVTSTYTPDNVSNTTPLHTLIVNTETNTFMTSSTHTSASTSIITQRCRILLKNTVHVIYLLLIFVF